MACRSRRKVFGKGVATMEMPTPPEYLISVEAVYYKFYLPCILRVFSVYLKIIIAYQTKNILTIY